MSSLPDLAGSASRTTLQLVSRPGLVLRDKMQASLLPKKRQQKTAPSKLILIDIMLEGSNSLLPKTTNNCLKLNLREYRVVVNL